MTCQALRILDESSSCPQKLTSMWGRWPIKFAITTWQKIGTGYYARIKERHYLRQEIRAGGTRTGLWIRRGEIKQAKKLEGEREEQYIAWFKHLQGVKYG